jgi:hypothetical protein
MILELSDSSELITKQPKQEFLSLFGAIDNLKLMLKQRDMMESQLRKLRNPTCLRVYLIAWLWKNISMF